MQQSKYLVYNFWQCFVERVFSVLQSLSNLFLRCWHSFGVSYNVLYKSLDNISLGVIDILYENIYSLN